MDINGRWFTDPTTKRTVLFKGVNLGGGTKLPMGQTSHERNGYWLDYDRKVSFIGRPFPLNEADEHLSRLVNLGFNLLRFIVTWEAVEHEGPGIYDQDYLDYVVQVLKKCQNYGIHVYIDPHQDTWSRHCGGSGHPGWTLILAGLNPLNFPSTNAAIVHNLYPEPSDFPKMIWNTNYQKIAAATLFTLFFAGKTFAPKCTLADGTHVQDYLQQHYINCFKKVATTIKENGLENTVVIGYDTMNEPGQGYLSVKDLTKLAEDDTDLKMGLMPTAFQGMLLGSGVTTKVENWEFKWNGPKKTGQVLVDPQGTTAWLDEQELQEAYDVFGWKRASSWPAGCIWATHDVWDKATNQISQPTYFTAHPVNGNPTKYIDYWLDHLASYAETIRSVHSDAILFVQPPILEIPPKLPASLSHRVVYAPHWYDGLTLVKKKWCNYNVDYINLQRGKYGTGPLRFVRALRVGEKAIRQCFVDQLNTIQTEGLDNIGEFPCILGEIGIPYDMELEIKKAAAASDTIFTDIWNWIEPFLFLLFSSASASRKKAEPSIGDSGSSQNRAMDASINALEKNLLNYTLWNYMADNNDQWGDCWNGEDLSIWQASNSSSAIAINTSSYSDLDTVISNGSTSTSSTAVASDQQQKKHFPSIATDQYLENTSTDSLASNYQLLTPTYNKNNILGDTTVVNARDIVSLHRPHPRYTTGIPLKIDFVSPTKSTRASFEYTYKQTSCDGPTEIYVPARYFPLPLEEEEDLMTKIVVSSGEYKINLVNHQYWILSWWIEKEHENEAKLNLTGISLLV